MSLQERFRPTKGLWILCLILAWYNTGIERFRVGDLGDIPRHPLKLFVPPWLPLRAYVSRNGDEKLYWNYARLILGEDPDLNYLAEKRQGNQEKNKRELAPLIRAGHAWRLPYRDFPFEYPPLSLALMLLPMPFVDSLPAYRFAYGLLMALLTVIAAGIGVGICRRGGEVAVETAWLRMAGLVLALGPTIVGRFDVLPALLVIAALSFVDRETYFPAGACLGLGVMAKLYPIFLLAIWLAWLIFAKKWRAAGRLLAGALVAVFAVSLPFLFLCPASFLRSSFLYGVRPYEIETFLGAMMVLWKGKAAVVGSFGSFNVLAPGWLENAFSIFLPASILGCMGLGAWRGSLWDKADGSGACRELFLLTGLALCLILLTSKVLSPQFLIWAFPLLALYPQRRIYRTSLWVFGLTQIFYPYLFDFLVDDGNFWVALLVTLRNGVLVYLGWACLQAIAHADSRRRRQPHPATRRAPPARRSHALPCPAGES